MRTTHARRIEARVHETGLPRTRQQELAEDLGPRLLLATDLSEASRAAEERAIELAVEGGRELIIVAVVGPADDFESARARLDTLAGIVRWRGSPVQVRLLVSDEPAEVILEAVTAHAADAIVMGHASWCDRPDGVPVCGHLVNTAPCPILAIGAHVA